MENQRQFQEYLRNRIKHFRMKQIKYAAIASVSFPMAVYSLCKKNYTNTTVFSLVALTSLDRIKSEQNIIDRLNRTLDEINFLNLHFVGGRK